MDLGDAGAGELARRDGGEVEVALAARARRSAGEARVDLLADLVAAAARAGPISGGDRAARRRPRAARATPSATIPPASAAPAAVQRGDGAVGGEQHRQAVGDEDERGGVARAPSPGRPPRSWAGAGRRLGGAPDARAVDLAAVEEALPRRPDRGGEPRAVLVDVRAASSSVSRPRLSESKGPSDTPPRRVENSAPRARAARRATCSPSQRNGAGRAGQLGDGHQLRPQHGFDAAQLACSRSRTEAARSCASRSGAAPASVATIAASRPRPTAGPCRPGGDEVVAGDRQAAVAEVARASAARRPRRPSARRPRRPPRAARARSARHSSGVARRAGRASAGARRAAATTTSRSPAGNSSASSRGAATRSRARGERGEVGTRVRRRSAAARATTSGIDARTPDRTHRRAEPVALERQQRRGLRLAQQQAQLGAEPRAA